MNSREDSIQDLLSGCLLVSNECVAFNCRQWVKRDLVTRPNSKRVYVFVAHATKCLRWISNASSCSIPGHHEPMYGKKVKELYSSAFSLTKAPINPRLWTELRLSKCKATKSNSQSRLEKQCKATTIKQRLLWELWTRSNSNSYWMCCVVYLQAYSTTMPLNIHRGMAVLRSCVWTFEQFP